MSSNESQPTCPRPPSTNLPWTGERMVPNASDIATELFHWQRYLYFRPWYDGRHVVDAASGEGYGANYASAFASETVGLDLSGEAVAHASSRYPHVRFVEGDVCAFDYSLAELVVSFETIEHLPEPEKFLEALKGCPGNVVISTPNRNTHSPGHSLHDAPLNPFHTVEWTPSEFADLIRSHFPDRQVRFLSQEGRWPGLIREGLDEEAMYTIAVIGDGELPKWPRLGLAMPVHANAKAAHDAVLGISRVYPGEIEFAVVANGADEGNRLILRDLANTFPHMIHLVELDRNEGFAGGCNAGLEFLWQESWFDYFGVVNDDVLPATDCVSEMVCAMVELEKLGYHPGLLGPTSNIVAGAQQVEIGEFGNYAQMLDCADAYHRDRVNSASATRQLRGLFLLIHPECLNAVGGFDTRFGLGNMEDDDFNLRAHYAGFTLWIADGAFLYHEGSSTFRKLGLDYEAGIERNLDLLLDKWDAENLLELWEQTEKPERVAVYEPLHLRRPSPSGFSLHLNGENVDLVHQASDLEFAVWIMSNLKGKPRTSRKALIELLSA
ncbi:MAG: methyltransferase domain-containing protein [Fimbriimonadaceae bacterium]|nr:methyltransferase domain-containing protein [Fimbriimonadaceae bacterium]